MSKQWTMNEVKLLVTKTLKEFEIDMLVINENREMWKEYELQKSKNKSIKELVELMMRLEGRFELKGLAPWKEVCPKCSGTGEIYKFYQSSKYRDCNCKNGFEKCKKCDGTGIDDGIYKCSVCDGKKQVICLKCQGSMKVKYAPLADKIEKGDKCWMCKGRGFLLPPPPAPIVQTQEPLNPVISKDLAAIIKTTSDTKE